MSIDIDGTPYKVVYAMGLGEVCINLGLSKNDSRCRFSIGMHDGPGVMGETPENLPDGWEDFSLEFKDLDGLQTFINQIQGFHDNAKHRQLDESEDAER